MSEVIKRWNENSVTALRFVPMDENVFRLMLFMDASFPDSGNLKSEIGFALASAYASGKGNIIIYCSSKFKTVERSTTVLAAEVHTLIYRFGNAFLCRDIFKNILRKENPVDGTFDSRTVLNKLRRTALLEK